MLKAILIDDEPSNLESLTIELRTYCTDVNVCAACDSAEEGLAAIETHAPDVVFLDIEMPQMNGFDLLRGLPEISFEVIFVTAYDRYAVSAFEFNAVDYLLKPILREKLIAAVEKVKKRRRRSFSVTEIEMLVNHIQQFQKPLPNIALPCAEGLEFIPVADIHYAQAEGSYTYIHLGSGRKLLLSRTLKDLEKLLEQHNFLRVHQSYLVNMVHIRKYVKGQGGYLVMQNGDAVPVARSRKEVLANLGRI